MFSNFKEIEEYIYSKKRVIKIALAGSNNKDALLSISKARKKGLIDVVLIGPKKKTEYILDEIDEEKNQYEFVDICDENEIVDYTCRLVKDEKVDIPMKGQVLTSTFMHGILNKEYGFVNEGALISQGTVFEYKDENRIMIASDCAINITPDYYDKVKIINNSIKIAESLKINNPKVAILAPLEIVNPKISSTIEASMLSKANDREQIKNCIVDGPLALDNAVSLEAAEEKQIVSPVAGKADILIMPDLTSGNIFTKSLTYFGNILSAGVVAGTVKPVIMASRSDKPENKYYSILMAILRSI